MRQIKNQNLAQLLLQLRFTPAAKRRKQLDSAEKLLAIINKDRQYPFEFICFRITGFYPKAEPAQQVIKGSELAEDLAIFISKLSGQLASPAGEQAEKVYTIEELAESLGISTKTIERWRKRGLAARRFIFNDGRKRLGLTQSAVDQFLEKNPQLTIKAKSFERLTNKQKELIIKKAISLAAKTTFSRHRIISRIASEIGRAHETVRYTIADYEKSNSDKPIFHKPSGVISPSQAAELHKLFKQGFNVRELMERFNRSKSSIYRIINQRRARALLARKIEFVASDEFLEDDAFEKILKNTTVSAKNHKTGSQIIDQRSTSSRGSIPFRLVGGSLAEYMQTLEQAPQLNRQSELELFRRYNYLKYLACIKRADIKAAVVPSRRLKEIEKYLAEAEDIKKMIIEANLRLVVGIAQKHTGGGANLLDLVGEGNFSLISAVEKFDYTRGFRFATFATWVIAKDYARKIPAEAARPDRAGAASIANIQRDLRTSIDAGVVAVERARQSLVQVIADNLNQREQYIIIHHFGLLGTVIRKKRKTLQQIGEDLNLSKERVRQIELGALQKLRQSLSAEEFELLTG